MQEMAKLPNGKLEMSAAVKFVNDRVTCDKWASIFRQNLESKSGEAHWKFNVEDLANERLDAQRLVEQPRMPTPRFVGSL